jgi:hypothetical protein
VAFGTTAGTFNVTLYENGRMVNLGNLNPQTVKMPDYTAVIFDLGRIAITSVDLQVVIMAPPRVVYGGGQSNVVVQVSVFVKLPSSAQEPVTVTSVSEDPLSASGGGQVTGCTVTSDIELHLNQMTLVASCSVTITSGNDVTLRVSSGVIVAVGQYSGLQYTNSAASFTINVAGTPRR